MYIDLSLSSWKYSKWITQCDSIIVQVNFLQYTHISLCIALQTWWRYGMSLVSSKNDLCTEIFPPFYCCIGSGHGSWRCGYVVTWFCYQLVKKEVTRWLYSIWLLLGLCKAAFMKTPGTVILASVKPYGQHWPTVNAIMILGFFPQMADVHSEVSVKAGKGTVTGFRKTVGIPTGHVSPYCNGALGNPKLYLDQPVTKGWCQAIGGHVSYPTDSPTATWLGLCSSLCWEWLGHKARDRTFEMCHLLRKLSPRN